jgi:hypothetical protein
LDLHNFEPPDYILHSVPFWGYILFYFSDVTAVSREVMFASQKDHNFVPIADSTERLDEEKGDSSRSGLGSNSPDIWVPPIDVNTSDQSEILTIKGDRKVKSGGRYS